ncbi:esterase B2-like [Drosophila novamexicana]|uniref:esterase B2-like n=1 Tax=Drosophila novamexicana TaxID=47314 RepID=UPI0011E60798|nr:esterase B2-like [Drosophila novamexicana]
MLDLRLKDPSLEVPGNAGLKDQVLALKWVKQYISHFNGDVNNITVFGESAGGCSTHYMMCTEQTRGLFHKAIPMSGTLHNYWSNTPPADFAYRLAKAHGYEGENIDRLVLEHLRGVAPHQLVNHSLLTAEDRRNGLIYAFGPTVEPYIMPDCVAPKRQLEMAREAWSNELPVMMGGVSFEGLFMYPALKANLKGLDTLPQDPLRIIPYEVLLLNTKQQNLEFSNKLIKLYFGDARPSSEHIMNFLDYYSYKIFWHGFHRTLQARLAYAKAPTYYYRFDFDSPDFNFYRKKFCGDDIKKGVAHADELSYLFRNSQSWKLDKASGEYRTIQRLVEIWTSFAATSNPNCAETAHLNWQPAQQELPQRVLNIDNEVKIIDQPEHEKLLVWDSLYKKEQLF